MDTEPRRTGVIMAVIATALASGGCSDRSPANCWSTETLRVEIGGDVYDMPASVTPTVYPYDRPEIVTPRYDKDFGDLPRLIRCQRPSAVPLEAEAVRFHFANEGQPDLADLARVSGTISAPRRSPHGVRELSLNEVSEAVFVASRSPEGIARTYHRFGTGSGDARREFSCRTDAIEGWRTCKADFAVSDQVSMRVIYRSAGATPDAMLADGARTAERVLAHFASGPRDD